LRSTTKQGCGVGSPVIRLRLRLLEISIIRLRLQLRPSAVLVTYSDNSFQMNSYTLLELSRNAEACFKSM